MSIALINAENIFKGMNVKMNTINVIGLGYIGLPTALMLAASNVKVTGTDLNKELVEKLRSGRVAFEEPGIVDLFNAARANGITFSNQYINTDVYIVAVPTPYEKGSKKIDPLFIISAVEKILEVCNKGAIIIIESTISPKTIDKYIRPLVIEKGFLVGEDLHLVHAPERIIPGKMIYELRNNSRTIGTDSKDIGERVKRLYSAFCKGDIVVTDIRTAEMTKVVENTYRDINIAFANELAKICREDNMDVYEIIRIANMHPRVNILQPGPGVGGHCISVDPWFLVGDYPGLANIILAARKINDSMPEYVLSRIHAIMKNHKIMDVSKIGFYGLTYKEDVDDIRESPTLQILESMAEHLAFGVKVYDPFVKKQVVDNQYFDFEQFIADIEIVVVLVSHSHIKNNIDAIKSKIILDTKNIVPFDDIYKL